jgi:hypothetical protein
VNNIDRAMVRKILELIWCIEARKAQRLRQDLEKIFNWTIAHGYRASDNPAEAAKLALPAQKQIEKDNHHEAIPYSKMPSFMSLPPRPQRPLCIRRVGAKLYRCWVPLDCRSHGQAVLPRYPVGRQQNCRRGALEIF